MENQRCSEIDLLKCVCILTVVYIHSISTSFEPSNFLGYLASDLCQFAVPGLFFAAGFLFDKRINSTGRIIKKKLVRLLPPYLFCSLCIQFLNVPGLSVELKNLDAGGLIYNLVFGNTLGIYYYVFVLFYLFAGSLVLRHVPGKWVLGLWGLSALLLLAFVKGWIGFGMSSMFMIFRHPFFHLFAYLSGWVFSLYYETAGSLLKQYRAGVICGGIVLVAIILVFTRMGGNHFSSFPILTQLYIYICITLLITAGMWIHKFQAGIRFFSNASYGIYLLHFPIVRACQSAYPEISVDYSFVYAFVSWCVGIAGSILIIFMVQKLSGRYSRYLVGC
ncbi:MAG: acyltransferase family protein [Smithellaceae bacterium]